MKFVFYILPFEYSALTKQFFYQLMEQRYVYPEISLKACHDVITAVEQYESESYFVSLFALHLSGIQQDAWKYIHLVKRLVQKEVHQDLMDILTYRKLVRIIYPDRLVFDID
jgi:fatty acid-binding protein DegV